MSVSRKKSIDFSDVETQKIIREKLEIVLQVDRVPTEPKEDDLSQRASVSNGSYHAEKPVVFVIGSETPDSVYPESRKSPSYEIIDESNPADSAVWRGKASKDVNVVIETSHDYENIPYSQKETETGSSTDDTDNKDDGLTYKRRWLVLAAAFISVALATGFSFNMSVMYVEWLQEFGKSNSETASVQSVCNGLFFVGGFLNGIVVTKYGPLKCGIIGGIMSALGLSISFFGTSIVFLVIFIGVIAGMGFSLTYISSSSCVGMYFKGKQRLVALAFTSIGSGIGGITFPSILASLVQEYGWRGTMLIIGALMLHLVVCSCLFTPPAIRKKHIPIIPSNTERRRSSLKLSNINADLSADESNIVDNLKNQNQNKNGEIPPDTMKRRSSLKHSKINADENNTVGFSKEENQDQNGEISSSPKTSGLRRVSFSTTDLRQLYTRELSIASTHVLDIMQGLLKNRFFMFYCLSQALILAAMNSVLIFFIDYYQFKGLSRTEAVSIYMYMSLVSTFFRIIPGFIKQIPGVSVLTIPLFSSLMGAVALVLFTVVGSSYSLNALVACLYGLSIGGMVSVMAICIVKLVGQENYSTGLGMSMTISGIFNALSGPIAGFIRDSTGDYNVSFLCAAAAAFLSSILFLVTMVCRYQANLDIGSRFDFEMTIRRKSRRRSSLFPWRRKSVDVN